MTIATPVLPFWTSISWDICTRGYRCGLASCWLCCWGCSRLFVPFTLLLILFWFFRLLAHLLWFWFGVVLVSALGELFIDCGHSLNYFLLVLLVFFWCVHFVSYLGNVASAIVVFCDFTKLCWVGKHIPILL